VDHALPGAQVGIGLRAAHYAEIAERLPPLAFLEVHSENYFGDGGSALAWLERLRAHYPVSLHGVGLSLGSADPLDERHLSRLAALAARVEPMLVSEHLSWSSIGGHHANDLLPLPFTQEALDHVVDRIGATQDRLGRRILVENVSTYARLPDSRIPEAEFVAQVVRRSGCGLLLDVNNVFVNAGNHGFDPRAYLAALDGTLIGEMHLAGFERADGLLVDTHAAPVADEVWSLYEEAVRRFGARPTAIERDANMPPLDTLLGEAARARKVAA
jgi:uncharacterized protein (UPF0276 family)